MAKETSSSIVQYINLLIVYNWWFICVPTTIFLLCSIGIYRLKEINDVRYQFTSTTAQSLVETRVIEQFESPSNNTVKYFIWLAIRDVDKTSSVMSVKNAQAILDLEEVIDTVNITSYDGSVMNRHSLCTDDTLCRSSASLMTVMQMKVSLSEEDWMTSPVTRMTFPIAYANGISLNLGRVLLQVTTNKTTSRILGATAASLFITAQVPKKYDTDFLQWQHRLVDEMATVKNLDVLVISDALVSEAVKRSGQSIAPYIGAAWLFIVFVAIWTIDGLCPTFRLPLILIGIACPVLGTTAAFGILSMCGVLYQPIVFASIIMIMAVGVDDVFLLMRIWSVAQIKESLHSSSHTVIKHALTHALPSMTLTSVTSALSFSIGLLSTTPAIFTFCLYSALAVLLAYISHMTIFVAVVVRWELKRKPNQLPKQTINNNQSDYAEQWATLLSRFDVRCLLAVIYTLYCIFAIIGVVNLKSEIVVRKLLHTDEPMQKWWTALNEMDTVGMKQIEVIVNNPGDLRDTVTLDQNLQLVQTLESQTEYGSEATVCWLRNYLEYLTTQNVINFNYTHMEDFLETNVYYQHMIHYDIVECEHNSALCIISYKFSTPAQYEDIDEHFGKLVRQWRLLYQKEVPLLNATIFAPDNLYHDQIESMQWSTKISAFIGLVAMTFVCAILMYRKYLCVVVSALAVFGANLGVFGFMQWWGLNIDPLCMAALLMSIGLSVDFCAHSVYHYYDGRLNGDAPKTAMVQTFTTITKPLLQAAATTSLAGIVPVLSGTYLGVVFCKTLVLVVALGLVHSLVFVPALLLFIDSDNEHKEETKNPK